MGVRREQHQRLQELNQALYCCKRIDSAMNQQVSAYSRPISDGICFALPWACLSQTSRPDFSSMRQHTHMAPGHMPVHALTPSGFSSILLADQPRLRFHCSTRTGPANGLSVARPRARGDSCGLIQVPSARPERLIHSRWPSTAVLSSGSELRVAKSPAAGLCTGPCDSAC